MDFILKTLLFLRKYFLRNKIEYITNLLLLFSEQSQIYPFFLNFSNFQDEYSIYIYSIYSIPIFDYIRFISDENLDRSCPLLFLKINENRCKEIS